MSCLLRKLEKKIWMAPEISEEIGGLQADSLKNFQTEHNKMSVFLIGDEDESLERVLAAIATTRDVMKEMDYATIEYNVIEDLGIKLNETLGNTPDDKVNAIHIDLVDLTAEKIYLLAYRTSQDGKIGRMGKKQVIKEIADRISSGDYKISDLNEGIRNKIKLQLEVE